MKIGIFGDSFSADDKMNNTESWIDILRNKHDIENHSLNGTNLYYSVLKFKEHFAKYDKNIFVVTQPSRVKIADRIPCPTPRSRYISGIPLIEKMIKNAKPSLLIDAYRAVLDYYKYIQDDIYDEYIHELMLDDIKKTCTNVMLIPGFTNSIPDNKSCSLIEIRINENKTWGYDYFIPEGFSDIRNCHLTKENNSILAKKILDSIDYKFLDLNLNDFETPLNKEFYIIKR